MNMLHPIFQMALAPYIHADQQESAENAAACAQIEHDKAELSDALYCATMICTSAGDTRLDEYLPLICRAVGIDYPPRLIGESAAC